MHALPIAMRFFQVDLDRTGLKRRVLVYAYQKHHTFTYAATRSTGLAPISNTGAAFGTGIVMTVDEDDGALHVADVRIYCAKCIVGLVCSL
jgi:hypothetical protein